MSDQQSLTRKPKDSSDSLGWLWALIAAVAAVAAPLVLVAALLYWLTHSALSRVQYALLAVASAAALFVGRGAFVEDYADWLNRLLLGRDRLDLPVSALFVAGVFLASLVGVASGTKAATFLPAFLRRQKIGREEFLPSDAQRKRLDKVVAAPVDGPTTSLLPHAEVSGQRGRRRFPLGLNEQGVPFWLSEQEVGTHGMIFGSTGSGKSETIKVIAAGLADLGWDGLILDLKEDTKAGGLRDWVFDYADFHRIPFQELRLSSAKPDFWFDTLAGLGRDEARDAIMSLTAFDDDYYQQLSKKLMGQLLRLMYLAYEIDPTNCPHPTLYEVARILSSPKLAAATKKMRAIACTRVAAHEFDILENPSVEYQKQAASWGAKLGQVFETQAGATVLRPGDNRTQFDVTRKGLCYVGLDSQGKADLTRLVSSAVLQRLSADSAQRTTGQTTTEIRPKFIIVDEANWVDRTIVQNLLSRARSAGISIFLATQGPRDWIDKQGDDFGRLSQNVNISVIMKQGDPDSAELCANYLGTQAFFEQTLTHRDGDLLNAGSIRRETDYRVSPEQLRELRVGEAVIRVGNPEARLSFAKIVMRDAKMPTPARHSLPRASAETGSGPAPQAGPAAPAPPV